MADAQSTASSILEPPQLLKYVPAHRILICKVCQYALQPLAISRHLKDYHQIRRGARRPFMRYVASFDIQEPENVAIPASLEGPVPFLPVVNGFACCNPTCRYVSMSAKLMTTHGNSQHQATNQTGRWRRVKLQTFFRGKHLRYFEVSPPDPQHEWTEIQKCNEGIQRGEDKDDSSGAICMSHCPSEWGSVGISGDHAATLDTLDLALLHHFKRSTCFTLSTDPSIQKIWETAVPEMASANYYLMQGLLACSALHLAFIQPSLQQELTTRAVSYQALALPLFRSAISCVDDHTCHTIYAFSRLLVIFAFASQPKVDSFLLTGMVAENDVSSCLHLIRGGCSMLFSVKPVIESGPLRGLIPPREEHTDISAYQEDPRLSSLAFLSALEPDEAWQGKASVIYLDGFMELRTAFRRTYTRGTSFTVWDVVHHWPARISDEFVTLLRNEHPGSLVLVAHYCILLKQLEAYWYMNGYAARLLSQIYIRISRKWQSWIRWPLQDVGLDQ